MGFLHYDKRKDGAKGRSLTRAIPALEWRAGDRVTEEGWLGDIGRVEELSSFPARLVFWRQAAESLSRRRNPLFDNPALGFEPSRLLVVDQLHAVNLGVMQAWCKFVIWEQIEKGLWTKQSTLHEQFEASALVIRTDLKKFYTDWDRSSEGKKLTRISRFSTKHLGKPDDRTLRTKGAET